MSDDNYGLDYTPDYALDTEFANTGYTPSNISDYAPASSDWFAQEEANAGPMASFADIQKAYPEAFSDPSSWAALASKLGGNLASAAKTAGSALVGKTGSLGGLADLARAMAAIYAYSNKSGFGTAPGSQLYGGKIDVNTPVTRTALALPAYEPYSGKPVMGRQYFDTKIGTKTAATGGIMELAHGGVTKDPRYLDGPTDGMADKINTSIDDKQRAKLSHGEFVIPADVVSHLGNGNSTAGAQVLYNMMDRVRKARTGTKKQGKQINPAKFTPGGIAGYAGGGAVAFADGGSAATDVGGLSNWSGDYVTQQLGRASGLANAPYQAYTGPLTAGTSPLQQQAFGSAQGLNTALGPVGSVQSYMNPYTSGVTDVQNAEARRQAEITRMNDAARLTNAGAFGGSRQAIMESEGNRNLATLQNANVATGLNTAWNNALTQQKNVADYNLKATDEMAGLGGQQRAIEQQGIEAQKLQREKEIADPYEKTKWAMGLLGNMPISGSTSGTSSSGYSDLLGLINALGVAGKA